jgi:hypothetical protein
MRLQEIFRQMPTPCNLSSTCSVNFFNIPTQQSSSRVESSPARHETTQHVECRSNNLNEYEQEQTNQLEQQQQQLQGKKRTGTQEPRLHHVAELRRRALALEELLGVVPAHPALGGAAPHQHDLALILTERARHDRFEYLDSWIDCFSRIDRRLGRFGLT